MNAFTEKAVLDFATAVINWTGDTIKAILLQSGYGPTYNTKTPPDINNLSFLSDISAQQVGSAVSLAGKSGTFGQLGASDTTIPAVTGATVVAVAVYKDTGTSTTSPIVVILDTGGGLPLVPNGGDVVIHWDTNLGVSKI